MRTVRTLLFLGFGLLLSALVAAMAGETAAMANPGAAGARDGLLVLCLGGVLAGVTGTAAALGLGHARAAVWIAAAPALCALAAYGGLFALDEGVARLSRGDVVARVVAQALFAPFAVMLLVAGLRDWLSQRRLLSRAKPVEARIIAVAVETGEHAPPSRHGTAHGRGQTRSHTPAVRFAFAIGGVRHEGTRLMPSAIHQGYASRQAAQAALRGLAPGQLVQAWADPAHPADAFLFREPTAGPAVFLTLGLLIPAVVHALAALLL